MTPRSGTISRPARRLAGVAAAVTLAAVGLVGATGCTTQTCGGGATATPTTGGQGGGSGIVLAKGFTSHGSTSHYYSRSHEGDTGGYDEDSGSSSRRYRGGGYHTYGDDDYDSDCSGDSPSPSPSDSYVYYDDDCTYSWCPTDSPSADDPYSSGY